MITHNYKLRLITPAFLGGAGQQAMWRTPPIKALIRQWWRVAVAQRLHLDFGAIRPLEAALFGSAADDESSGASLLRLRLDVPEGGRLAWSEGAQSGVKPENADESMKYIAWGLIGRGSGRADRTALAPKGGEGERTLRIAYPQKHPFLDRVSPGYDASADLATAFSLIHHFGCMGGRSRNGWGSVCLEPLNGAPLLPLPEVLARAGTASLQQRLAHSWATGIAWNGSRPLIWESATTYDSWGKALRAICQVKRELRRSLTLNSSRLSARHILGLPVKDSRPIRGNARMPSPLRFKVMDGGGGLRFRVYAMPHGAPDNEMFAEARADFAKLALPTWQAIEGVLDQQGALRRFTVGGNS
jgi:CRISPR-associated protein Cmr1